MTQRLKPMIQRLTGRTVPVFGAGSSGPGWGNGKAAMLAARDAMSPMGRMGHAWDVARASVFLASNEAAYITEVCLPVDGGLSCLSA